jgi:hypothetical protein
MYRSSIALLLLVAGAAQATPFENNLIVNPGAESDEGDPDGCAAKDRPPAPITGWTRSAAGVMPTLYGAVADAARCPGSDFLLSGFGRSFFAGGASPNSYWPTTSAMTQRVSLSDLAATIDGGKLGFELSAWLGGASSSRDNAEVIATFYDGMNFVKKTVVLGAVYPEARNYETTLVRRGTDGIVPARTRYVSITVRFRPAVDASGKVISPNGYTNGYADEVNFSVYSRADQDGDSVIDRDDVCPTVSDPDQLDGDSDGIGDACDSDELAPPSSPDVTGDFS